MYYYDEPYYEPECSDCEDHSKVMNDLAHWIEGLIELCYSSKELDRDEFENHLEEIAHYVGLKIPAGKLTIAREPKPRVLDILDAWKSANNQYLKSLTYSH